MLKELRRRQDEEEERRRQEELARTSTDKPDGADRRSETGSIKSGRKCLLLLEKKIPDLQLLPYYYLVGFPFCKVAFIIMIWPLYTFCHYNSSNYYSNS